MIATIVSIIFVLTIVASIIISKKEAIKQTEAENKENSIGNDKKEKASSKTTSEHQSQSIDPPEEKDYYIPENKIAKAFFILGFLEIAAGFICGAAFAQTGYGEFSASIFLMWFIGGMVSGLVFIGIGEIIKLLFNINIRMENQGLTLARSHLNTDKAS